MKIKYGTNGVVIELENGNRYLITQYGIYYETHSSSNKLLDFDFLTNEFDVENQIKKIDKHKDFILRVRKYLEKNEDYARNHEKAIEKRFWEVVEGKKKEEEAEKEIKRIVEAEKKKEMERVEMEEAVFSRMEEAMSIYYAKHRTEDGKLVLIIKNDSGWEKRPFKIIFFDDEQTIVKQVKSVKTVYNIFFKNKIELNRLEDGELEKPEEVIMKYALFDEPEEIRKRAEKILLLQKLEGE